jgi:hypothetical protein
VRDIIATCHVSLPTTLVYRGMNADLDEDVVADSEDDELFSQDMTELFSKSSAQSLGVTGNAGSCEFRFRSSS